MIVWPDMIQGSEDWFRAHAGRPTASQFAAIITPKGEDSSQWPAYALKLTTDCIRPDLIDPAADDRKFGGNKHTDRGNELEPEARSEFEQQMGLETEIVGFVTRDDGIVGCSPDAFVLQDGNRVAGLEIKCPTPENHAATVLDGMMPAKHKPQVHGSMAVTGIRFWYFMSFCPGMIPFISRVEWDEYTDTVVDAIDRFLIYYGDFRTKNTPKLTGKS